MNEQILKNLYQLRQMLRSIEVRNDSVLYLADVVKYTEQIIQVLSEDIQHQKTEIQKDSEDKNA